MRVGVFAAHPDDEVLGVGGTIERHRDAGDEVMVFVAYTCRIAPPDGAYWWKLRAGDDVKGAVETTVTNFPFDIVYTHHGGDINADHRLLHDAVMVACRPYAAPSVKSIRTFYTSSSTEWGEPFHPTLYVDVTQQFDRKLAAMEYYRSEMRPYPHPRSVEALYGTAQHWGSQAGFRYAEAFHVVRDRW